MANSNSELIIIIPIVVVCVLLALLFAIPLLARRYCYDACDPEICGPCCDCTEFCLSCCKQVDDRKGPDRHGKIKEDYGKSQVPLVRPIFAEPEKNHLLPISQETEWSQKPNGTPHTPQYIPPLSAHTSLSKLDYSLQVSYDSMDTVSSGSPKVAEVKLNGNAVSPETPFRGRGSIPDLPSSAPYYSKPSKKVNPIVSLPEERTPLAPLASEEASDAVSTRSSVFEKTPSSHHSTPPSRRPSAVREYKWSPRAGVPVISPKTDYFDQTESGYTPTKSYLEESESREAARLPRRFRENGNDSLAPQSPHKTSPNNSSLKSHNLSSYETPSPSNESDPVDESNGSNKGVRPYPGGNENTDREGRPMTGSKSWGVGKIREIVEEGTKEKVLSTRSFRDIYSPPFQRDHSKSPPDPSISYSTSDASRDSDIGGREEVKEREMGLTVMSEVRSAVPSTFTSSSVVLAESGNRNYSSLKTTTTRTTSAIRREETYAIQGVTGDAELTSGKNLEKMRSFLTRNNASPEQVSEKLVVFETASKSVSSGGAEETQTSQRGLKRENNRGIQGTNYDMSYHEYTV